LGASPNFGVGGLRYKRLHHCEKGGGKSRGKNSKHRSKILAQREDGPACRRPEVLGWLFVLGGEGLGKGGGKKKI